MLNRVLSGIVAAGYLVLALASGEVEAGIALIPLLVYVGFCLLFIWFGEELGDCLGIGYSTRTSPGWAVSFLGWVLLLMPIGVGLYLGHL